MGLKIANYLTRYYVKDENPFVSLNDFPLEQANKIKNEHCMRNNIGGFYAQDDYLVHRLEIEKWIYEQLLLKGGNPKNNVPIYMCLGKSPNSEYDIKADIQKNSIEIRIPLSALDLSAITFTYPDSMYEFELDKNSKIVGGKRTNTPKVYLYNELETAIKYFKDGNQKTDDHYIEAQIWNREMLYEYLEKCKEQKTCT